MKSASLLLIILLVIPYIVALPATCQELEISSLKIRARILSKGVLAYKANVTLSKPISSLRITIPREIASMMLNYSIAPKRILKSVNAILDNDVAHIEVSFTKPSNTFVIYLFSLAYTYSNKSLVRIFVPLNLKFEYPIRVLNFTISYPEIISPDSIKVLSPPNGTVTSVRNQTFTNLSMTNLEPGNVTMLIVDITASLSWPAIFNLRRYVRIEGNYYHIKEELEIQNLAMISIPSISIWLPPKVKNVKVYGYSAEYARGNYPSGCYRLVPEVNLTLLSIKLWYPLRPGEKVYIRIEYDAFKGISVEKGYHLLELPLIWKFEYPIKNITIIIEPGMAVNIEAVKSRHGVMQLYDRGMRINYLGIPSYDQQDIIRIKYQYNWLLGTLAHSRIILAAIITIAIMVLLSFTLSRYMIKPRPTEKAVIPPEVESLLKTVDDYIALRMEQRDLEFEYSYGRIRTSSYISRRRKLLREADELRKQLSSLIEKIKTSLPHLMSDLDQLTKYLRELDAQVQSLIRLEQRYRTKRMKRIDYLKLSTHYRRSLDRTLSRLNTTLIRLRERIMMT